MASSNDRTAAPVQNQSQWRYPIPRWTSAGVTMQLQMLHLHNPSAHVDRVMAGTGTSANLPVSLSDDQSHQMESEDLDADSAQPSGQEAKSATAGVREASSQAALIRFSRRQDGEWAGVTANTDHDAPAQIGQAAREDARAIPLLAPSSDALDACSEARTDCMAGLTRANTPLWRMFDVTVAFLGILAFLPLIVMVACAIRLSGKGPVLFVQRRVGRDGALFPCLKFRSMVCNSSEVLLRLLAECPAARAEWDRDQKLRDDPRITRIGALLRKTSLDELPQLFNVLAGHMSIVGPRPIVSEEIERYGHRFEAYCSVRPGLTGLWQVSGRNEVSYEARVRLDALYSKRKSLLYDVAICMRTVPAVLASRGCY